MQLKRYILSFAALCLFAAAMPLSAQTTEGKDFWVTFMRSADNDPTTLTLTISAKQAANVTVENTYTGMKHTLSVPANGILRDTLQKSDCYVGTEHNNLVTNRGVHVISDVNISLIAANYRDKSFDVAAVLPTDALLDDYVVCTYPATDHDDKPQGTHFAIIATEDNTIVDFTPSSYMPDTIKTLIYYRDHNVIEPDELAYLNAYLANPVKPGLSTPVMMKGQVYYYWTGENSGDESDLTSTTVKARDGKHVAVFNGAPHTNIPNAIRDRDHIYSQAMPTAYWGTRFALTSSLTTADNHSGLVERIDKVRVQALEDGTVVVVNGDTLHVFDFTQDTKHYFEFEFGANTVAVSPYPAGITRLNTTNCFVETSCPCGVHLFMVSNQYDYPKDNAVTGSKNYCNGDPSMIWINPIEQQLENITFGTFETTQVKDHFVNIVTEASNTNIVLDGKDITSEFTPMVGNANYKFTRKKINNGTHILSATRGLIAHVYGFGEKESYGYPAGAKTVPLEQYILINGEVFSAESQNTLCGKDTIHFACDLNYEVTNITWNFGDGSAPVSGQTAVDHYYPHTGDYQAYVLIDRESSNLCQGQTAHDSIPVAVHIGKLEFAITDTLNDICENKQLYLYFSNTGTALSNQNCTFLFNDKAKAQGFTASSLSLEKDHFLLTVPNGAEQGDGYSFQVQINTGCGDTAVAVGFTLPFDPSSLLVQRWDNVLGVRNSQDYKAFQWYKDGVELDGETGPVLNLHDQKDFNSKYIVKITTMDGEVIETCPYSFTPQADAVSFSGYTPISSIAALPGEFLFFATTAEGTADLYDATGKAISSNKLNAEGGYVRLPQESGIYVLSVRSDNEKYSVKIFVK